MTKMTKKERFKKFTKDNADLIVVTSCFVGAAGIVFGMLKTIKSIDSEYQTALAKEVDWVAKQNDAGRRVIFINDGSYVTIDADTPYEQFNELPE